MENCSLNINLNAPATSSTDKRRSQATRNVVFPRASMEEAKKAVRGFVRGTDGKLKIAPWPGAIVQTSTSTSTNAPSNSSEKRKSRKHIPLEPINIQAMAAALGPIPETKTTLATTKPKPVSTRRSPRDKQVRKELFKVPQRKRLSFGTKAKWVPKKSISVPPTRRSINLADSPLLDIDEAAAILKEKRVVETPQIVVSQHETPPIVARLDPEITASPKEIKLEKACATLTSSLGPVKDETPPTVARYDPEITNSDKEFAELEKTCATPKPTSLRRSKNSKISAIRVLAEKNQADLNSLKQIVGSQAGSLLGNIVINLEENQKKLTEMVSQLELEDEDKENLNPKSSNAISKNKQDLRKFTLNKNFAGIETQSPRTKKAVDLYNTVRNDCVILCTPKLNRNGMDTPQCSAKKRLSRKIQNQCLLLQDTPRPECNHKIT